MQSEVETMQVEAGADGSVARRGRGFNEQTEDAAPTGRNGPMDFAQYSTAPVQDIAARSIEGWVIAIANVHEEATEEDLNEFFSDFGPIKSLHLNLDRRTGYVKGYALIEYAKKDQALLAIKEADGATLLEQTLQVGFAFVQPPPGMDAASEKKRDRERSKSPGR